MKVARINKIIFSEVIRMQLQSLGKIITKPEIERRFLVNYLQKNWDSHPHLEYKQGYLKTDDEISVRLREAGNKHFYTVKTGTGKVRDEAETSISDYFFNSFWHLTKDRRLKKTRYEIPHKDLTLQLDIFKKYLKGLVMVEVEFNTIEQCDSFIPPEWFGEEVTDNRKFTNKSLAIHGIPKGFKGWIFT